MPNLRSYFRSCDACDAFAGLTPPAKQHRAEHGRPWSKSFCSFILSIASCKAQELWNFYLWLLFLTTLMLTLIKQSMRYFRGLRSNTVQSTAGLGASPFAPVHARSFRDRGPGV